jgi:hypothetical protein
MAVCCAGCGRWWVPLPASSGPPVKLDKGRPLRSSLRLEAYRLPGEAAGAGASTPAPAVARTPIPTPVPAAGPAAGAAPTSRIPVTKEASRSLRVMAQGPETDLRGVFELGGASFLIGRQGCHVNLPRAPIPDRAIRIRASQRGFVFEGIGGFAIPLGTVSVPSGTIEPGGGVRLMLEPYLLGLETSATPGSPIPDLEAAPKPAERPAAAPPPPAPPPPRLRERPTLQSAGPKIDVRDLLQDFAVDMGPGGRPFEERGRPEPAPAEFDGDMTIADVSARGFMATRAGDPLKDLDLQLVRTEGPAAGRSFQLTKSPLVIGRAEGDLIIQDRRVSGKHAQLDVTGPEMYALKDLASTNGTTINGRPISIATLKNGDVISFGGVSFRFVARVQR